LEAESDDKLGEFSKFSSRSVQWILSSPKWRIVRAIYDKKLASTSYIRRPLTKVRLNIPPPENRVTDTEQIVEEASEEGKHGKEDVPMFQSGPVT
jgi:hypothetical protein